MSAMKATTQADFCPARLRLARTFNGWTQAELGQIVGVSHQYVGYLEAGFKAPAPIGLEAIADATGFEREFFLIPLLDEFQDEECHFRRRASTPVSVRNRALAHGTLFGALATYIDQVLSLPVDDVPTVRVDNADEIERAAELCRMRWGLGRDLPIKNLTRAVERAGVFVTTFEGCSTKVDAFSRAGRRSVIVLSTDKQSPSRSRFDLAHETGHLVMHGGLTTGDGKSEKEADYFASALLLPASGFVREFPRSHRLDWCALFRLKTRWGISVGAQVRRAHDLRLIDAAQYQRAYKYIAAQGWLKGEPDDPEPEKPELVVLSLAEIENHYRTPPVEICHRLSWRPLVFERIAGVQIACPRSAEPVVSNVIQFELAKAERARRP